MGELKYLALVETIRRDTGVPQEEAERIAKEELAQERKERGARAKQEETSQRDADATHKSTTRLLSGQNDQPHDATPWASQKLLTLIGAAKHFWEDVDQKDRSSHLTNPDVITWLVKQGFSKRLAEAGATIIRPEKVKPGRRTGNHK